MFKASGLAHVTLTVSDIKRPKAFYEELFKATFPMDNSHSFSLRTVGIPCWFTEWKKTSPNDRFDENRVGLDHVAFKLETQEDLQLIIKRLKQMKVNTKGLQWFANKYPYVCFRDPDNIQTEFFIPKEL